MYFVGLSLDIYIAWYGFMHLLLPLFVYFMEKQKVLIRKWIGTLFVEVVPPGIELLIQVVEYLWFMIQQVV